VSLFGIIRLCMKEEELEAWDAFVCSCDTSVRRRWNVDDGGVN
jgi:hypothetical protein